MFISPAYAQAAGADGGLGGLMSFMPLVLIFVVFYFLLIRPQQKKAKQHREMLANIRRNDVVVTSGGIVGTVSKVIDDRDELLVEIADGVKIRVVRGMVAEVRAKTEPAGVAKPARSKSKAKEADEDDDGDETQKEPAQSAANEPGAEKSPAAEEKK